MSRDSESANIRGFLFARNVAANGLLASLQPEALEDSYIVIPISAHQHRRTI